MIAITVDDTTVIRSFAETDAEELFEAVNKSRRHLQPWLPWVTATTKPEHSLHFIQQSLHQHEAQETLALAIVRDGKIAGSMGMHHWDQAIKRAQIGYWISGELEGKGIVYKSLLQFISFLFEKAGLNKIEIHFAPGNLRSAKLAERLGFRTEGVIRQGAMRNGAIEDLVVTGLLKSEWLATKTV